MTTPRDIYTYGGIFTDALPVEDTTTEQSSAFGNRLHDDVAQMTRTTEKAIVTFQTSLAAAPVVLNAAVVATRSHYGTGAGEKPVVTKTATGTYTLVFSASYLDGLGASESMSIFDVDASVRSTTVKGRAQASFSATTITVLVMDTAWADSDLGGSITISVRLH